VEPSQILLHFQLSYEASKTVTLTANLPWKVSGACGYGNDEAGVTAATSGPSGSSITGGVGNTFNPGDGIQPGMRYAYSPYWLQQPFGVYVNANVKL
jgi:hypothetical protein